MLSSPTKGVKEATGVLAKLYRTILMDLNITPLAHQALMSKYLSDPRNRIPNNGKARSSERGNMIKDLRRPDMTFKVFLKHVRFLQPIKVEFVVKLHWRRNKVTVHGLTMETGHGDEGTE